MVVVMVVVCELGTRRRPSPPLLLLQPPSAAPSVTGQLGGGERDREGGRERVWVSVLAVPGHMIWRAGPHEG